MKTRAAAIVLLCCVLVAAACASDDDDGGGSAQPEGTTTSPTTRALPPGPAADMSTELTAGNGVFLGEGTPPDLEADGYVQREYAAAGTATSYKAQGELAANGQWKFAPDAEAPYKTRVVVRAPADPAKFSGTVVVEWLNVSGGVDANPEWTSTAEELVRSGDVWVGVSAQLIGVEGGPVLVSVEGIPGAEDAGKGLKKVDPARYGSLEHPGDGFSFDIFTQAARAIWGGAGLDGLQPQRVLAAGESQSAFALVSYYNGVQPLTEVFDGFFVHSRGGSAMSLVEPGESADIAGSIGGTATIFRTDQAVPVLDVQTENDLTSVLGSYNARQPDNENFRLWEVAGTAHADAHLVGDGAKYIECGAPINNGPMHIVAKAGLHALKAWVSDGTVPNEAPRLDVAPGAAPEIRRDDDGIALGGIRTPPVDVPVATLSGVPGPSTSIICILLGSTKPFTDAKLAQLYPSRAEYEQKYNAAADDAISTGFVLAEDREALIGFAEPDKIAN
jgi:hypothetical protein